jgi:hypothetical protein
MATGFFIQDKTFHFPQAVAVTQNGFSYPTLDRPSRLTIFEDPFH